MKQFHRLVIAIAALFVPVAATIAAPGAMFPFVNTAPDAPLPSRAEVLRDGVPLPFSEWQDMTAGRTVWYFTEDGLWGRETYRPSDAPGGGMVTFEHRDGDCLDAAWTYDAGLFCFDFGAGPPHCFEHIRWQDRLFALSVGGDVQEVKRIDRTGLTCGAAPVS
ncbi:MAG: hypothetical protein ACJA1L_000601 [Paracoccaceae bacterium]|jgi:hypothetical protein